MFKGHGTIPGHKYIIPSCYNTMLWHYCALHWQKRRNLRLVRLWSLNGVSPVNLFAILLNTLSLIDKYQSRWFIGPKEAITGGRRMADTSHEYYSVNNTYFIRILFCCEFKIAFYPSPWPTLLPYRSTSKMPPPSTTRPCWWSAAGFVATPRPHHPPLGRVRNNFPTINWDLNTRLFLS